MEVDEIARMEGMSPIDDMEGENTKMKLDVSPEGTSIHAFIKRVVEMEDLDICIMLEDNGEQKRET